MVFFLTEIDGDRIQIAHLPVRHFVLRLNDHLLIANGDLIGPDAADGLLLCFRLLFHNWLEENGFSAPSQVENQTKLRLRKPPIPPVKRRPVSESGSSGTNLCRHRAGSE